MRKLSDPRYQMDIDRLLPIGHEWDIDRAARLVASQLIAKLPGEPWRGTEKDREIQARVTGSRI